MTIIAKSPRVRRVQPIVADYHPEDRELVATCLAPVITELYPRGVDWLSRRLDDVEHHRAIARLVTSRGQLDGVTIETPKSRRRTKLSTLWVAKESRNQGLGSALIDDRRRDWLRRGIKQASLTAHSAAADSLSPLLLARGFELVAIDDDRYGDGRSEAVFEWRSVRDPGPLVSRSRRLVWSDGRLIESDGPSLSTNNSARTEATRRSQP
jgi:GNAT superfamily N-acetyltransferase